MNGAWLFDFIAGLRELHHRQFFLLALDDGMNEFLERRLSARYSAERNCAAQRGRGTGFSMISTTRPGFEPMTRMRSAR